MALTETRPPTAERELAADEREAPSQIELLIGSGDHLTIGRLFIGFGLLFLALSALGLTIAGVNGLSSDGLLSLSDTVGNSSLVALVLTGAMPLLLGLGIYIVPRQVGSAAIAFPRAAALSLWTWLVAAGIFFVGVALDGGIGGPDPEGSQLSNLSMGAMMAAIALGSICVATTVLSHRPIGMGLSKVPFFSWSMLVAAPIWTLTFGSTIAHVFVAQISQANPATLVATYELGISWFLRAPSIYMLAIPVLGIAVDVVAKATGRRIPRQGVVQALIGSFAVISFGAWTQSPRAEQTFIWVLFVLAGAVPVVGLAGALVDVLRRGKVAVSAALMGSLLAILMVLGGVLAGALQALDTAGSGELFGFDAAALEGSQGMFLLGAALLGALAGLTHWSRRIFSSAAGESAGKAAVAATLLGAGLGGTAYLIEGIGGASDTSFEPEVFSAVLAIAGALLLAGALAGLAVTLSAARVGAERPDPDDDDGLTLEWAPPGPVVSGVELELAYVNSPYPLLDERAGDPDAEES